jgi:hypothetical protein
VFLIHLENQVHPLESGCIKCKRYVTSLGWNKVWKASIEIFLSIETYAGWAYT